MNYLNNTMGNLIYLIAVILMVLWAVGYFGYKSGELIHILIVVAAVMILLRIISGRRIL